jgi:GT2 family glycosyltransferase
MNGENEEALSQMRDRIESLATHAGSTPLPGPEGVTIIVKTFERPRCIVNFLESVRRHYADIQVMVCEDSRVPLFEDGAEPSPGVHWLTLPFSAGHTLGAGRNHLVGRVTTRRLFLADDDHEFTVHTRLDLMAQIMDRHGLDIVGGAQDRGDYGGAIFERKGDVVFQRFHEHHGLIEPGLVRCDRVSNTFMAATAAVDEVGWEENVYGGEHAEFFWRATQGGLSIAQVGYVYVNHRRDLEEASGWSGHLFGWLRGHRDLQYYRLRQGEDQAESRAERQRRHVLTKNGIQRFKDVRNRRQRARLEALIGTPFYDAPPVFAT